MNIENKKQIFTVILAGCLGLVATFMTSQYIKQSMEQKTAEIERSYEERSAADREMLVAQMETIRAEFSNKVATLIKNQQESSGPMATEPRKVVVDSTMFSELTPEGKRAFTIMIDSLSAVGGLINPNDRVDVIAHLNLPNLTDVNAKPETLTSILFQNIKVLAVGANFKPIGDAVVYQAQQKARSLNVTLALAPEEVALLTFAQRNGQLQLTLRPPDDENTEVLNVASWASLSDYVLDKQGTELKVPQAKPSIMQDDSGDVVQKVIPIYRPSINNSETF